jgi:hypothetical protein
VAVLASGDRPDAGVGPVGIQDEQQPLQELAADLVPRSS